MTGPFSNYRAMHMTVVPVSEIILPQNQPKILRPEAVQLCARNMSRYGQIYPILVNAENEAIAGFEFLAAAAALGWDHVNVIQIADLTHAERKSLMLALAKLPELSDWDDQAVKILIDEITISDPDLLDLTGFETAEIDIINETASEEEEELEALPPPPDDDNTVSRLGDIFDLAGHRIICGNALDEETHKILMGGAAAQAVCTDPPYGIKIEGNVSGLGKTKHKDFAMAVGEMTFEEFAGFLESFLKAAFPHLAPGALLYVFMDRRHLEELFLAGRRSGLKIQDLAIWDKMSGGMGGLYRSQHEPCVVFKYGSHPHVDNVKLGKFGRYRTNVWKHRGLSSFGKHRTEALSMHPTVKPSALMADIIKDCTKRGDIILDPFLGSGTTLIAAEKTGRTCYAIELEPKYVDVAIKRWQSLTAMEAVHLSGLSFAELKILRLTKPAAATVEASDV